MVLFRPMGATFETGKLLGTRRGIKSHVEYRSVAQKPWVIKEIPENALSRAIAERLASDFHALFSRLGIENELVRADPFYFLARPWIDGISLKEILGRRLLKQSEAIALLESILRLLKKVHDEGVLHRGIRPSNIIIPMEEDALRFDRATLVDFCLDELEIVGPEPDASDLDVIRYFPPEQLGLLQKSLSPASDFYSLAMSALEGLTGQRLFFGLDVGNLLSQKMLFRIADPRWVGAEISRALAEMLVRLLKKDPVDRYQTAQGLLADLAEMGEALKHGLFDPKMTIGQADSRNNLTEPGFTNFFREIAVLDTTLANLKSGNGSLVFIEGESGSGKSRLLEELAIRAHSQGMRVFRGFSVAESAPRPFESFQGVIQSLLALHRRDPSSTAPLRENLKQEAEAIVTAVPELEEILGQRKGAVMGREEAGEMRSVQGLFSLLHFLGNREAPALFIIDDCQWIDRLSLRLIEEWSNHLSERGDSFGCVVCAFRGEEVAGDHPIRVKVRPRASILISPFDHENIRSFAQSMAGPLPEDCVATLSKFSRGNPFFLTAVLHEMVDTGTLHRTDAGWEVRPEKWAKIGISLEAAELISKRLNLASRSVLEVIEVAAVIGREFRVAQLEPLSPGEKGAITLALEDAERRHFVSPLPERDGYRFYHDQIREALLAGLDAQRRKTLHLKIAEMLLAHEPGKIFDLAYHFDAAGESSRALPFALEAARIARSRFSLGVAESQVRIALRGVEPTGGRLEVELRERLGEILLLVGKYPESKEELEEALRLARSGGASFEACVEIQRKMAEVLFKTGQVAEAAGVLETALESLGERVPRRSAVFFFGVLGGAAKQLLHRLLPVFFVGKRGAERKKTLLIVRLYSRLSYAYYFTSTFKSTWALLREINRAEKCPNTAEAAQAYADFGIGLSTLPWLKAAFWSEGRSLEIRKQLDDVWGEGQSLHFLAAIEYIGSRFDRALERARDAQAVLDATGDRWEYHTAALLEALALWRKGDLNAALHLSQEIYRKSAAIADAHSCGFALQVWARSSGGNVPEELIRRELSRLETDMVTSAVVHEAEALRMISQRQFEDAARILRETLERLERARVRLEFIAQIPVLLAGAIRRQVEALDPLALFARKKLLKEAREAVETGLEWARRFRNHLPEALREAALISALEKEGPGPVLKLLEKSVEHAVRQGARLEAARSRLEISRLCYGTDGTVLSESRRRSERHALRRELSDCGAEFELESYEKPVPLSLIDRFEKLMQSGRKIIISTVAEEVTVAANDAVMQLLRTDFCKFIEHPMEDWPEFRRMLKPTIINEHALAGLARKLGYLEVRSGVWMPISMHGSVECAFVFGHREVAKLFGWEELRLTEFIATITGAAFENAEGLRKIQESVRERDEFIEVASHELKTPLTSLQIQSEMVLRLVSAENWNQPATRAKLEALAENSSSRIRDFSRLVNNLVSVLQAEQVEDETTRESVDLAALVKEVVNTYRLEAEQFGCKVEEEAPEPVVGYWNRNQIREAIANLLSNALKFGARKPVRIRVKKESEGMASLEVQDFGIGIPETEQRRIFERYTRAVSFRHFGGLGIGLYLTKKIVEAHHGAISVQSAPGAGAVFRFELPLHAPSGGDA